MIGLITEMVIRTRVFITEEALHREDFEEELWWFNTRRYRPKNVTRRQRGEGSIGPLPSSFDTIHLIDLMFGTYNELSLYYQLIETTWCLIGFHGNHNHINNVTSPAKLNCQIFRFF